MPKSSAPSESRFGGNVTEIEQDRGKEQREGNGDGDDQRAAHVAQEEKENQRDQQHAVGQIAQDGVRGVVHQVAAVEVGNEFHALRQAAAVVQFVDFLVQRVESGIGLRALAQQDDAFDHIVIVDDGAIFMADGFAELAQTNFGRLHDHAKIAHPDRRSVLHL